MPKCYKINLDLPPVKRWRHVIKDKNEHIHNFYYKIMSNPAIYFYFKYLAVST